MSEVCQSVEAGGSATSRQTLGLIGGGGLLIAGFVAILVLSGLFKSDYERLHDQWYELVYDHLRKTDPEHSAAEDATEAEKIIADIQKTVPADSYFNVLLPESQRRELALPDELKEFPTYEAFMAAIKAEAGTDGMVAAIKDFGVEIYPWLLPVAKRVQDGTASKEEADLFNILMLHKLLRDMA